MKRSTVHVLDTRSLRNAALLSWNERTNRQPSKDVIDKLDPDGWHVVTFSMIHNDHEYRLRVLAKLADTMDPAELWVDYPLDQPSHRKVIMATMEKTDEGEWQLAAS